MGSDRLPLVLALLLVAGGCRRESPIEVYQVPKESSPVAAMPTDPHAGMEMPRDGSDPHSAVPPSSEGVIEPGVSGEVPAHWKKAGGSSMRVASYRVDADEKIADISLVVLAGGAGGVLDNVNRWRAQIGQEAIDGQELDTTSEKRTTPVGKAVVVDLVGDSERMVAAVIPVASETWFYKMRGDPGLVGQEKQAFLRWIETAEVKVVIPEPAPPVESPHAAGPPADIEWKAPDGWQEKPGDSLRVGIFSAPGGAEVSVSRLGGDGGGDLPNVNRWRRQIGLEPLATLEGAFELLEVGDVTMSIVDMEGTDQGTVAAWTLRGGTSWFFKLTGPKEAVRAERDAFRGFLKSIRFDPS